MKLWFKKPAEGAEAKPTVANVEPSAERTPAVEITLDVPDAQPVPAPAVVRARETPSAAPGYRSDHKSLYKQLLAGLYDAVLITDPKGYVIEVNARVQEFFLYDGTETWDMAIGELIPGVNASLIERIRQGLSGDRFVLLDARCVRKDRTTFTAEVAISSIDLMNEGDFVFAVRNVERRRGMLQKLRGSHNALMQALSADALCDREGRVRVANPSLLALWGYGREEDLVGTPITALWPQDAANQGVVAKVMSGTKWQGTIQATARNGLRFQVKAQLSPEREGREGIVGLVCSFLECAPAGNPPAK
jgi:PAS domain S-box-containing protein